IVPLLLWRRSRPLAFAALVTFHLTTMRLFQLGMFPWIMMASSLVFLPPDGPRQLAARLRRWRRGAEAAGEPASAAPAAAPPARLAPCAPRLVIAALAVHFAIQLALPLRHLVYP